MKTIEILKRDQNLGNEVDKAISQYNDELAAKARKMFSYTALDFARRKSNTAMSIQKILKDLDVRPFTADSVKKYKDKMVRQIRIVPYLFATCCVAFTVAAYLSHPAFLTGTLVSIFLLIASLSSDFAPSKKVWEIVRISLYTRPIPEFALQTAINVSEELEKNLITHEILICSLEQEQKALKDPFLILRVGDQDFYLEVWNEHDFKGIREA